MHKLLILSCLALSACASNAQQTSVFGGREGDGPFLVERYGLDRNARQALAAAELQALQFTRAGQAVSWQIDSMRKGTVSASQPFRVAERECRRLVYAWSSREAVQTVCRGANNVWKVVG